MFKIGDKVRVKDLRGNGRLYSRSGCCFRKGMEHICNKEFLVCNVYEDGDIEINNGFRLGEEWVELVNCHNELASDIESIEVAIMQHERQIEKLKRMLEVTDEFKSIGITVKFFNDEIEL